MGRAARAAPWLEAGGRPGAWRGPGNPRHPPPGSHRGVSPHGRHSPEPPLEGQPQPARGTVTPRNRAGISGASSSDVTHPVSLPRVRGGRQLLPTAQHAAAPRAPRAAAPGLRQVRPRGQRRWESRRGHREGAGDLQRRVVRARGRGAEGRWGCLG